MLMHPEVKRQEQQRNSIPTWLETVLPENIGLLTINKESFSEG